MSPFLSARRGHYKDRNAWPLIWSLTLHLWFAGLALTMVWKIRQGHDTKAVKSLLEPGDGGERATLVSSRQMERSRVRALENSVRKLQLKIPSGISLAGEVKPLAAFDPAAHPYLPGSGLNGGVGKSLFQGGGGDGYGPGSGIGHLSNVIVVLSRRPGPVASRWEVRSHLAIVLDVSGSMRANGGGENSPALREFIATIATLPAGAFFNVICFSRTATQFREDRIPVTPTNAAEAVAWARECFHAPRTGKSLPVPEGSSGSSRLDLGISAALQDQPDEVILISDGQPMVRDGNRSLSHDAILARVSGGLPDSTVPPVIHAIATREAGSGFMSRLAREFRGQYRIAGND
jgi:hypothetical protein